MLDDLLLEDFFAKLELIDTIDKVFVTDEKTLAFKTSAYDWCATYLWIFNDFFQSENLVQANEV